MCIRDRANFTNEGGYRYRYRYLKNIMGLWMIQSIRRELNGVSYVEDSKKTAAAQRPVSYTHLDVYKRQDKRNWNGRSGSGKYAP